MMKSFIKILLPVFVIGIMFLPWNNAFAGDIKYGYNAKGDYVPTSINGEQIHYGYNAKGDYVPKSVGNTRINYGYNAKGDYVPTSYGNSQVKYGYNAKGNFVPIFIDDQYL